MNDVSRPDRTGSRTWLLALVLTLLLHALVLVVVLLTRPFSPTPVAAQEPDPIQLVFVDPPQPNQAKEPTFFTELPQDRADQPPKNPDFLSNVDSRARDEVPGGTDALPHSEGRSEAPHLEMIPGAPEPPTPEPDQGQAETSPAAAGKPVPETADAKPEEETPALGGTFVTPVEKQEREKTPPTPPPDPLASLLRKKGGTQAPDRFQRPEGLHDLIQEALRNNQGNAELFGGISMNTTAWNYAPWLMRFIREFHRDWNAPYAYYIGIVYGWHVLQLEISQDGTLLRMDLLEQEGHNSLVQASELSFRTVAPFEPLPSGFPEKTLVLNIRLNYPRIQQR